MIAAFGLAVTVSALVVWAVSRLRKAARARRHLEMLLERAAIERAFRAVRRMQ